MRGAICWLLLQCLETLHTIVRIVSFRAYFLKEKWNVIFYKTFFVFVHDQRRCGVKRLHCDNPFMYFGKRDNARHFLRDIFEANVRNYRLPHFFTPDKQLVKMAFYKPHSFMQMFFLHLEPPLLLSYIAGNILHCLTAVVNTSSGECHIYSYSIVAGGFWVIS